MDVCVLLSSAMQNIPPPADATPAENDTGNSAGNIDHAEFCSSRRNSQCNNCRLQQLSSTGSAHTHLNREDDWGLA
jgi:hypothetical protein